MNGAKVAGQIRHGIAALGMFFASQGIMDQELVTLINTQVDAIIGGVMTLWAAIASWRAKEKAE